MRNYLDSSLRIAGSGDFFWVMLVGCAANM